MKVAVVGAGAVGGWIGGRMTQAGTRVTLVDAWPEHVRAMNTRGLTIAEGGSQSTIAVDALHVDQIQALHTAPVDVAFICTKLYDTDWASALIAPCLTQDGFIVTLQNALVEERIAARVGWGRTVGCIGGGLYVGLRGPGQIQRSRKRGDATSIAFTVGEVHGRITPRIEQVRDLLMAADRAKVTANLWGERWEKLVVNCMMSALGGISGLPLRELHADQTARCVMTHLAAQAIVLGQRCGFRPESVYGLAVGRWVSAAQGDMAAKQQTNAAFDAVHAMLEPGARSGTAQDLAAGRRTEIDFMNADIVARARAINLAVPTHEALVDIYRRIERGEARIGPMALSELREHIVNG